MKAEPLTESGILLSQRQRLKAPLRESSRWKFCSTDMAVDSQSYSRVRMPQLPLYDSGRCTVCE
jgi:hypothetical protein